MKLNKYTVAHVLVILIALLSLAAGVPKILKMPQELEFLSALGLTPNFVVLLGVAQVLGAALLFFARFRTFGAGLCVSAFLVSSVALLLGSNILFGLLSTVPALVLLAAVAIGSSSTAV